MTINPPCSSSSVSASDHGESTGAYPHGRACFKELMNEVNLFAVMFNQRGEIIYCNGNFLRLTGLASDEVLGRTWNEVFVSPEIVDSRTPSPDRLGSESNPSYYESDLLTRSGDRYRIRWKSISLRDPSGGMVGFAGIGEDITERKGLERPPTIDP
jgi:PAS domain S-box-containing protein